MIRLKPEVHKTNDKRAFLHHLQYILPYAPEDNPSQHFDHTLVPDFPLIINGLN